MKPYLSYGEIHGQYDSLSRTLEYMVENTAVIREFFSGDGDIVMLGCGSSYWMLLSAHRTWKMKTGRRTYALKAGDVALCPAEYADIFNNPTFFCSSRSGLTKDLLNALEEMKKMYPNAKMFSVTEYEENTLKTLSDAALSIPWANEESVCQTRSFSSTYVAAITIAAILGDDTAFIDRLRAYFKAAPGLYTQHEPIIKEIADPAKVTGLVTLGAGLQYGVVIEGAYIVIEVAQFVANYYNLLEYRHGPIVTSGEGNAVFICTGADETHERKVAEEIRTTGAAVYAVSPVDVGWATHTFTIGDFLDKEILALHFVFVMQSFAYYFAVARDKDPDTFGLLSPYITY